MINHKRLRLTQIALSLSIALAATPAFAQNTTSAIGGRISLADGQPAGGATITILHNESGSVSNVVTDAEGRYVARGLRTGGPYTITITKDGVIEKREGVYVQLAETSSVDATLGQQVQSVTVTGNAARNKIFNKSNMGSGTSLGQLDLQAQASIARNLQDYARIDPRVSQTDKEKGEISVAGQNSRYNSMTIDGVAVNDTFGLEPNGSPTAKQPISIEAIQSVQVNVANYDVTQKGYTGANINAVTKSGTNDLHGSVYYVFRNDSMVGERYNTTNDTYSDAPKFKETTKGMTFSGPIIKDKLFFFANYEKLESSRSSPAFGAVGSASNNVGVSQSAITGAQQIANDVYGFDPGSATATASNLTVTDKLLKLDWNISDTQRAMLRYAKTDQSEPIYSGFGSGGIALTSQSYRQNKTIETIVGQLFSDWTPTFSTEFRVSSRDYDSNPKNNADLPNVRLDFTGALPSGSPAGLSTGTRTLSFGTDTSRMLNTLGTKTKDAYLGANWALGDHEVKFGTDFSKNDITNGFLQNVYGAYTFSCVDSSASYQYSFGAITCARATSAQNEAAVLENYRLGRPSAYTLQVGAPGYVLEDAIAGFTMKNYGLFLQDTWSINKRLTVTGGLRVDAARINDKPTYNAAAAAPVGPLVAGRQTGGFGVDNTHTIDGENLYQPRVGFNYAFDSARPTQLRGGVGLFQGAAATVWMSNPFSNTGVLTRTINCSSSVGACPTTGGLYSPDINNQSTNVTGTTPAANVDVLSTDFKQPSIWKSNLAIEHELPWFGLVVGAEYLYTKNKDAIYYQNLNLGSATKIGTDGRELYYTAQGFNASCWSATGIAITSGTTCTGNRAKAGSNRLYNNVLQATRTDGGKGNVATVSIKSPLKSGLGWSASYTYTDATEVSPVTSSTSSSNYAGRSIFNPNENNTANSNYMVKDSFKGSLTYQQRFFGANKTTFGLFYEGRSGKPYSWTVNNDLNGDGLAGNDLMYMPSSPQSGQVVFAGDTATNHPNEDRFWSIVNANPAIKKSLGKVAGRNDSFAPWTNTFDLRISQEVPGLFKGNKGLFTMDFFNVGNLINRNWGHINEVAYQTNGGLARSFVDYAGVDAQGRYIYNTRDKVEDNVIRQEKNESQWAIQATVKYEF